MDFGKQQKLSVQEAKEMDMVDYLFRSGYKPTKIVDYWYLSPLRNEKTTSFKVNRRLNRWYDHGLEKGGNLIDFAILHQNCTTGEFLQNLNDDLSFHQAILHEPEAIGISFYNEIIFYGNNAGNLFAYNNSAEIKEDCFLI